jgi:hypothetical protein
MAKRGRKGGKQTFKRHRERGLLHSRIRRVLRAWPIGWQESRIEAGTFGGLDFRVGDDLRGFVLRVLYPDERQGRASPDAILTCSVADVIAACRRHLT